MVLMIFFKATEDGLQFIQCKLVDRLALSPSLKAIKAIQ